MLSRWVAVLTTMLLAGCSASSGVARDRPGMGMLAGGVEKKRVAFSEEHAYPDGPKSPPSAQFPPHPDDLSIIHSPLFTGRDISDTFPSTPNRRAPGRLTADEETT